jgi:hypothetical protein
MVYAVAFAKTVVSIVRHLERLSMTKAGAKRPSTLPLAIGDSLSQMAPSHGENRGSSPLGSANEIKYLMQASQLVSNNCPINVYGQAWTACGFLDWTMLS